MKEFMFIFKNGSELPEPAPEQMQANMQLWFAWVDKLKAQDVYVSGEALMPVGKTIKGHQPVVTDGPFAESKELVGGFFVVKAASIDEAVELASDYPDFTMGGAVEVREVVQF